MTETVLIRFICVAGHSGERVGEVVENGGEIGFRFIGRKPVSEGSSQFTVSSYRSGIRFPWPRFTVGLYCYHRTHGPDGLRLDVALADYAPKVMTLRRTRRLEVVPLP